MNYHQSHSLIPLVSQSAMQSATSLKNNSSSQMMSIDEGDRQSVNPKAIGNAAMSITKSSINNTKDEEMNDSCGTANPINLTAGQNHSAIENIITSQAVNNQK